MYASRHYTFKLSFMLNVNKVSSLNFHKIVFIQSGSVLLLDPWFFAKWCIKAAQCFAHCTLLCKSASVFAVPVWLFDYSSSAGYLKSTIVSYSNC